MYICDSGTYFVVLNIVPKAGETVLDCGASPGGWTRVMQRYGCQITAVDRSPLQLANMDHVTFIQGDAFAYSKQVQQVDYLLCDVAAYPEKTTVTNNCNLTVSI